MAITVVAVIRPLPTHHDAVRDAIIAIIPAVHAEPGCELYALHENKDAFLLIEKWARPEALADHGQAPALAELGRKLKGLVSGPPEVTITHPVPAGIEAKGAI